MSLVKLELRRRTSAPWSSKSNEHVLVLSNLLREGLVIKVHDLAGKLALDLGLDGCFLGDELAQALQITTAIVVSRLVALSIEPLERGEACYAEALAQRLVVIRIDLCDADLLPSVLEDGS